MTIKKHSGTQIIENAIEDVIANTRSDLLELNSSAVRAWSDQLAQVCNALEIEGFRCSPAVTMVAEDECDLHIDVDCMPEELDNSATLGVFKRTDARTSWGRFYATYTDPMTDTVDPFLFTIAVVVDAHPLGAVHNAPAPHVDVEGTPV